MMTKKGEAIKPKIDRKSNVTSAHLVVSHFFRRSHIVKKYVLGFFFALLFMLRDDEDR